MSPVASPVLQIGSLPSHSDWEVAAAPLWKPAIDKYIRLTVPQPFVSFSATVKARPPPRPQRQRCIFSREKGREGGPRWKKLPRRPAPNRVGQVYSEVEIQMCGGRRERLVDQLFPIVVTVVNLRLPTPATGYER